MHAKNILTFYSSNKDQLYLEDILLNCLNLTGFSAYPLSKCDQTCGKDSVSIYEFTSLFPIRRDAQFLFYIFQTAAC